MFFCSVPQRSCHCLPPFHPHSTSSLLDKELGQAFLAVTGTRRGFPARRFAGSRKDVARLDYACIVGCDDSADVGRRGVC
jgi:hypothetical protein